MSDSTEEESPESNSEDAKPDGDTPSFEGQWEANSGSPTEVDDDSASVEALSDESNTNED